MAAIHISKDEAARDMAGLLARLDSDTSFIIEDGAEPIAILQVPPPRELTLKEKLALLERNEAFRSAAFMDESFARDVLDGIESHREPLDSSLWDE